MCLWKYVLFINLINQSPDFSRNLFLTSGFTVDFMRHFHLENLLCAKHVSRLAGTFPVIFEEFYMQMFFPVS